MITIVSRARKPLLVLTLGAIAAMATGAAFAGWADHGADIFVNMAMTGLAWCL